MKRSEIKQTVQQRRARAKVIQSWYWSHMTLELEKGGVEPYEANARHLLLTELDELYRELLRQDMSWEDLMKLARTAQRTSRGWKAQKGLFDAN